MAEFADRNLLIAVLALQMDFIDREQLVDTMSHWVTHKSQSVDQILLERRFIAEDVRGLLMALVDKHLEQHSGDAKKSLAAVSSLGSVRQGVEALGDAQLEASIRLTKAATEAGERSTFQGDDATVDYTHQPTTRGARFRVLRPHARGGLGKVSIASDEELHREVALKEIQARDAADPESRARFVMEAEITGNLEHPGIVPVYGLGEYADGRPFYAMRFIRGDSLKEAVDRFHSDAIPDASERLLRLRGLLGRFVDVCQAIEYAHSRGVLHRDLKPGNIMLGKYGETLVVDWGLAKPLGHKEKTQTTDEATLRPSASSGSSETRMGSAVGTPSYMSPEQANGRLDRLGPRSDVYSLGATLYYVLTGRAPFQSDDTEATLAAVRVGDFDPPTQAQSATPRALEAVCLRAMALDPDQRYASPSLLAEEVERWLADEPVEAFRESWFTRAVRWAKRHQAAAAALLTSIVVVTSLLTLFFGLMWQQTRTLRAQVETLVATAKEYQENGDLDAAIRFMALAAGLQKSQPTTLGAPLQRTNTAEETLETWTRFRTYQRKAESILAPGIHAMDSQERPDMLAEQCTETLALFGLEESEDWPTALRQSGLSKDQVQVAEDLAVQLMLMKAVRLGMFDGKTEQTPNDTRAALRLMDAAEKRRPNSLGIQMCRMLFLRRIGEEEAADAAREALVPELPRTALDDYLLGSVTLHILKNPDDAIESYRRALARQPNHLGAAFGLYYAYREKRDLAGQLEALSICLALAPNHGELLFMRGMAFFENGDYRAAATAFDVAVSAKPDYGFAHYFRGRSLLMLEEWAAADRAFTLAFEKDPEMRSRISWRGLTRVELPGQARAAVEDARTALSLDEVDGGDRWRCARVFALAAAAVDREAVEASEADAANALRLSQEYATLRRRIAPPVFGGTRHRSPAIAVGLAGLPSRARGF